MKVVAIEDGLRAIIVDEQEAKALVIAVGSRNTPSLLEQCKVHRTNMVHMRRGITDVSMAGYDNTAFYDALLKLFPEKP